MKIIAIVCWLLMFLVSIDHLFPFCSFCSALPTRVLGILAWITFFSSIVYCGRDYLFSLFLLVSVFTLLGAGLGPFLEPPADPLEHLRRVNEWNCGKTAAQMPRRNRGLWHYSMAGNLLCIDGDFMRPEKRLQIIDATNGLFWGLAVACLYILALRAGLPGKWAFLSVLICFLFFGTNRFSYFRYYSFAPSFSSLMIYWLWAAVFFFKKKFHDLVLGSAAALICLPILWVNHNQEAVFLGFLLIIWLLINFVVLLKKKNKMLFFPKSAGKRTGEDFFSWTFILVLVLILWGVPQVESFRQWLSQFFLRDLVKYYTNFTVFWHGVYVGGRITGLRITDTFGIEGVVLWITALPYLWPGFLPGDSEKKMRIFILGILPFIGYFVPLFHFVWAANVKMAEYYRLCYTSMFWLVFSDFLFRLGKRLFFLVAPLKQGKER